MPVKRPAAPLASWFWRPVPLVFLSSGSIMVLELVAGRILAPYIGVSVLSWTGVIGVVLGGISLGNYVGGRLADRWAAPHARGLRLLGLLLTLGGLASLSILAVDLLQAFTYLEGLTPVNAPLIAGLGLLIVALFFVPCAVLGTLSPVIVKLAISDLSRTGRTVGRIYAAGTLGSLVGTFGSGFFLISRFGTHRVVWGVGAMLLLLGFLHLLLSAACHCEERSDEAISDSVSKPFPRWPTIAAALLLAATLFLPLLRPQWLRGPCTRETDYFCIQVREEVYAGETLQVLYLDRLLHSLSSLSNPTRLAYEYERLYAEATAYQVDRVAQTRREPVRALFIGGGGYTFPRYMEALYPGSHLDVIEIDPGVTEIAHERLGLARDTRIVTYNEDARMFLAREPDIEYDLVYGDAFNDFGVPYHLTTQEFNDRVQAWLAPDGLYLVNLIDGPWGVLLRSYTHTLRQTFAHVYLAIDIEAYKRSSRSTLVLIATDTPLDLEALATFDGGDGTPQLARALLHGDELDAFLAQGRAVTLTDRYAPVDQMLIPVFLDWVPD